MATTHMKLRSGKRVGARLIDKHLSPFDYGIAVGTIIKINAEANKMDAEANKIDAEANKMDVEANKMDAETNKMDVRIHKMGIDIHKIDAEIDKMVAETNKIVAEKLFKKKTIQYIRDVSMSGLESTPKHLVILYNHLKQNMKKYVVKDDKLMTAIIEKSIEIERVLLKNYLVRNTDQATADSVLKAYDLIVSVRQEIETSMGCKC